MRKRLNRLAAAAVLSGMGLTLSACVTVPVGSEEVATLRGPGMDVGVVVKRHRDPILIMESEYDLYTTWAVNRGTGDVCLGTRPTPASAHVNNWWLVPAGQELKMHDGIPARNYTAHPALTDPNCRDWSLPRR
jgi:hypothetical protein